MSSFWAHRNTLIMLNDNSSYEVFHSLCNRLEIEFTSLHSSFCERVFKTGSFRGREKKNPIGYNRMKAPFVDNSLWLKSKKTKEGKVKTYFITQPYLTDSECYEYWEQLSDQVSEDMSVELDCLVMGKEKSFFHPNKTNLVIIGVKEEIEEIRNELSEVV